MHLIIKRTFVALSFCVCACLQVLAQSDAGISKTWVADLGNGNYKNPIIHADYSDPDVCRVGDDYYMTASSFNAIPGLPILHSNDLVNWKLISYALDRQPPFEHFEKVQNGNGVWAPAIRYHNNEFYIYYPDPDFGIYLIKAKQATGPWSKPLLIKSGKGFIDPCPLWDSNGKTYLVHGWAGSRAGIKSIITINEMNPQGDQILDEGVLVYDGHEIDPTIEGPKIYKRNGYYYIFAPAGGVSTGWQLVLRSKNIYGPYERKVVMDQGKSIINGPHQGAWVDTKTGEDWFIHFQDKEAYGRVAHLQPMKWVNDWPVIGIDTDKDGKGEPVLTYRKPNVGKTYPITTPPESDEFNNPKLGLQWQWAANPKVTWKAHSTTGVLRLFSAKILDSAKNFWQVPNILSQKFPADQFMVTTKLLFKPAALKLQEKTGLIIMGENYAYLAIKNTSEGLQLVYTTCTNASKGTAETEKNIAKLPSGSVYLRVAVKANAICQFAYSTDGDNFTSINENFSATPGRWIGAKAGIFCTRTDQTNDSGYADFDWFRLAPVKE
ncbi:glycoside hydrolase [Solitalea longa]|uniref:Glycoside hydrolase n=1 Tax=Solitalea longa TaxID=2079460 RepID=A0A2S4ZZS0_9SPHI|nr:glycoside hydrolase 43 family protein [Solitalea longa]POY35840.1 glycoside hydrolase [Solitalea longa]